MKAEKVLKKNENQLMSIPGVNGVGISENKGQIVITVMVKTLTPELKAKLPTQLDGVPVKIDVIGEVDAF